MLGGDIGCLYRAHMRNAAGFGLVHVPQAGFGRQKSAIEMDRQQPLPVGKRKIDDRFDDLNADIADQHIDPTIFRHRVGNAFSTAASSPTFIATAKASEPFALISRTVASAASKSRSAMTGAPPSEANRSAISLPIPLAAPVMIATL